MSEEREILFRGKDLQEQNGWLYGYFYKSDFNKRERESGKATLIFTPDCDTFIYVPEYHNSWMVKAETVGQYTGLTDLHGTRIFEGDIIKVLLSGNPQPIGVVKYGVTGICGFCVMTERGYSNYVLDKSEYFEVIGNIHDNPELPKGE